MPKAPPPVPTTAWKDLPSSQVRDRLLASLGENCETDAHYDRIVAFALLGVWQELEKTRLGVKE
jgi:hypothetical protein